MPRAVKGKIAVHHAADSDRTDVRKRHSITRLHIRRERRIGSAYALPCGAQIIRPDTVFETVLPCIAAARKDAAVHIRENRLDPRRAKLQPERRFTCGNRRTMRVHDALLSRNVCQRKAVHETQ